MYRPKELKLTIEEERLIAFMLKDSELPLINEIVNFREYTIEWLVPYGTAEGGKPTDPEVYLRTLFLEYWYNWEWERAFFKNLKGNVVYKWFIHYAPFEPLFDRSTLVKFRRKIPVEVFKRFFWNSVHQCQKYNLISHRSANIDGTTIDGESRARNTLPPAPQPDEIDLFIDKFFAPENQLQPVEIEGEKRSWVISGDLDASFVCHGNSSVVGYQSIVISDNEKGVITNCDAITGSDKPPEKTVELLVEQKKELGVLPKQLNTDSEFFQGSLLDELEDLQITPMSSIKHSPQSAKYFSKELFFYIEEEDIYYCPAGKTLVNTCRKPTKDNSYVYEADRKDCIQCPLKSLCTKAKYRSIYRTIHEDAIQSMRQRHKTESYKEAKLKRKIFGEGSFIQTNRWHGLDRFHLKGLSMIRLKTFFTCAIVNIKKLFKYFEQYWGLLSYHSLAPPVAN